MTNDTPTTEEFRKNLESKFPMMEAVRKHEIKKVAHEVFSQSSIGKVSSVIYFIIAFFSIFIYWNVFDLNIIFSIFLAIITWFVVTFILDKILLKFSGIEKYLTQINEKEIQSSMENLKKSGLFK